MRVIYQFLRLESASGIFLFLSMLLALAIANSPLYSLYDSIFHVHLEIRLGQFFVDKALLHWINDGLMTIFFLMIGLEIKRELVSGYLSDLRQVILPLIGAIGGILVPGVIYSYYNLGTDGIDGWAIPTATDIAFTLAILSLFGNKVPTALKIFLLTLAIFDDLGAIIIIAIFYTSDLSPLSFFLSALCITLLIVLNKIKLMNLTPYLLIGFFLWAFVMNSGVHATLAGVVIALTIPIGQGHNNPLIKLETFLHPWVAYVILPIFAFANSGIPIFEFSFSSISAPVPLGIILGLFVGKQLGIFSFCWISIKLGIARLPSTCSFFQLYGVSILCGVGFTMSLFIATLAFEHGSSVYSTPARIGILTGSLASAVLGALIIKISTAINNKHNMHDLEQKDKVKVKPKLP